MQLSQIAKIIGCVAPIDSGGVAQAGAGVSLKLYNHVTFLVYVGNVANAQTLTVEECSDSAGTGNVAIAFNYRKASTGAAAKSVLDAAISAATNAGISIGTGDDNKIIAIEMDASELPNPSTKPYVRCYLTAGAVALDCVVAILLESRYEKDIPPDPTS